MTADPRPARTRRRRLTAAEREAAERFKRTVLALDRGCVAETLGGCEGPPFHAHHVIPQAKLRAADLADCLWLPQAGCCLCERHHRRLHNRTEPVPLRLIPARCVRFAEAHGFGDFLARFYPDG